MMIKTATFLVYILVSSLMQAGRNVPVHPEVKNTSDQSVLRYDVVRNSKVIGQMEAIRKVKGSMVEYQVESSVTVNVVIQLSIFTRVVGVFHQGQLITGSVIRKVNDNTRVNAKIILQNDRYVIQEDDEKSELREKIGYTTACLMHMEPIGLNRIFSENYKKFIPIRQLSPHHYELQLPDGNKNFYTYANGICIGAEVNTNISKAFFRLKK